MRRSALTIQIHRPEPKRSTWPHAFAMCLYVTLSTTSTLITSTCFPCHFQPRDETGGPTSHPFRLVPEPPYLSTLSTDFQIKTTLFLPSAALFCPIVPTLPNTLIISSSNISLPTCESHIGRVCGAPYRRYPNSPDFSIRLHATGTLIAPNYTNSMWKSNLGVLASCQSVGPAIELGVSKRLIVSILGFKNRIEVVKMLVDAGADMNIPDNDQSTALQKVRIERHEKKGKRR